MTTDMIVKLDTKELQRLIKRSPEKADAIVRQTAFFVEGQAKINSPYMTGANRNSIFTKTSRGNHGTPGNLGDVFPDVSLGEAIIAPSMEYSARLEFGFVGTDALGRRYNQAARPYLYPAMQLAPKYFEAMIAKMFEQKT